MIEVECLYDNEYVREFAYDVDDFPYASLNSTASGKQKYIDLPVTLDIETSTIKDEYRSIKEDRNCYESFMYHWQICVEGFVCFGRIWDDLIYFLEKLQQVYELKDDRKLVIYIQNLSYEFHFMYNFFEMTKVFATDNHKVLRCLMNDVFELRCAYYLSNMNLQKFIENTPNTHHQKGAGDLDYRKIFTPESDLTLRERGYCYNDVLGLFEAICELLKEDTLKTIPMTSTGYVRRDCRLAMRKSKANRAKFEKSKLDLHLYKLLKDCFRGGNTASNRYLADQILEDVDSWDISSSYPFAMVSEQYPTGVFVGADIERMKDLNKYNRNYCTIGRYTFTGLKLKSGVPIPYIPYAKCQTITKECQNYNGRILQADVLEIALTNVDFDIINNQYDYDELYVNDFFYSRKDYLPKELRDQIMKYFFGKTTLKDVEDMAYEYMKSKNKLNSIYGMIVTDILHAKFIFNADNEFMEEDIIELEEMDKYYKNRNNFLSYQWGVFVTAYARKNLQKPIDQIGLDVAYCDTDSVKFIGNYSYIFEQLNREIISYCEKEFIVNHVDYNGKRYYMGTFDHDGHYDRFITLGAKKYAYETEGDIHVTVAGLNKKQGGEELKRKGGLDFFKDGEVFYDSGRTVAQYNNYPIHHIEVEGVHILTASNIAIVDTTYTLGITDTMRSILLEIQDT